jgi:hypothetical protein
MKNAIRFLAAFAGVVGATTASAKELTFFFDVHSSGPEIYPCDAGLWQGNQEKFCHYKGTSTACNPADLGKTPVNPGQTVKDYLGNPVKADDPKHACICTGSNGGAYLMNFMRFKAAKWEGGLVGGENHMGWGDVKAYTVSQTSATQGTWWRFEQRCSRI